MEKKQKIQSSKKRKRESENEKMIIDNDDESSEGEYESESQSEEVVEEENANSDHSEDYEEIKDDKELKSESKKIKVTLWDEKNNSKLKPGEQLDFDNNAYEMLHRAKVEWPCLSIDFIIPENSNLPDIKKFYLKNQDRVLSKDDYPYSTYMIAGSQTNETNGYLYYMKWYNMFKTKYDDDPEKAADSDDEEAQNPFMKYHKVKVKGNVNRIKSMKNSLISAFWSDSPSVEIVNIKELIDDLELQTAISVENDEMNIQSANSKKRKISTKNITIKSINKTNEGFAIDWNNITPGVLAVGGMDKKIEIYIPKDENCSDFILSNSPQCINTLKGHTDSIEDIQWSPNQENVLSSCSIDKSIRFWDIRANDKSPQLLIEGAHESDVNVISWNAIRTTLLASGSDDNTFKVWDLRFLGKKEGNEPIAKIKWHRAPINSLMWDPFEESQLAVCSEDDRLSIWDFSVEKDDKQMFDNYNEEIPEQLVFLHQGQQHLKDVKFHPHFKSVLCSTSENGINVFKPAFDEDSIEDSANEEEGEDDIEMA